MITAGDSKQDGVMEGSEGEEDGSGDDDEEEESEQEEVGSDEDDDEEDGSKAPAQKQGAAGGKKRPAPADSDEGSDSEDEEEDEEEDQDAVMFRMEPKLLAYLRAASDAKRGAKAAGEALEALKYRALTLLEVYARKVRQKKAGT